jgi:hypothetical protein
LREGGSQVQETGQDGTKLGEEESVEIDDGWRWYAEMKAEWRSGKDAFR